MTCSEARILLSPFIDGELDEATRRDVHDHLQACSLCSANLEEWENLRIEIRREAPYHHAPPGLFDQVQGALRAATVVERRSAKRDWRPFASIAAAIVIVAGVSIAYFMRAQPGRELVTAELFSAHVRALMGHEIDVVSTDRHTVKPWFNDKLPFSPPVADLAADGFPLAGGRLDYVGGHPAAALMYRRNLHWIDVFVWPQSAGLSPPPTQTRDGYRQISWTKDGFVFAAVADLNAPELNAFAHLMQTSQ